MNGTCCTRQELEEVLPLQFSVFQAEQKTFESVVPGWLRHGKKRSGMGKPYKDVHIQWHK